VATFVLVHGGWGGGWEWRFVDDRLRASGHAVHRPTLTGLGERRHLGRPETDLETHIADVVAVLEAEELLDVVLVGQSYGGAVVTGVADRLARRVGRVVYVDAFVPRDGESVNDLSGARFAERLRALAERDGGGWQVPVPFAPEEVVEDIPRSRQGWYLEHIGPHPLASFEQPLRLTGAGDHVPRSYISCRPSAAESWVFAPFEERARDAGWDVHSLPVGHDAHVIDPDALATMLDRIAAPLPDGAPGDVLSAAT
jgi:pimeloyl-ACP methyl ester carboxylesterase